MIGDISRKQPHSTLNTSNHSVKSQEQKAPEEISSHKGHEITQSKDKKELISDSSEKPSRRGDKTELTSDASEKPSGRDEKTEHLSDSLYDVAGVEDNGKNPKENKSDNGIDIKYKKLPDGGDLYETTYKDSKNGDEYRQIDANGNFGDRHVVETNRNNGRDKFRQEVTFGNGKDGYVKNEYEYSHKDFDGHEEKVKKGYELVTDPKTGEKYYLNKREQTYIDENGVKKNIKETRKYAYNPDGSRGKFQGGTVDAAYTEKDGKTWTSREEINGKGKTNKFTVNGKEQNIDTYNREKPKINEERFETMEDLAKDEVEDIKGSPYGDILPENASRNMDTVDEMTKTWVGYGEDPMYPQKW